MEIRDTRNGEWHWVNNAVTSDKHLDAFEKVVYYTICTFAGYQEIHPDFELIAERSGVGIRKCKNAVQKLIKVGYISAEKGGGRGIANIYHLLKAAKVCILCTVSKGCTVGQERVHGTTIKGAHRAHHIYKKDKRNINDFSFENDERRREDLRIRRLCQ